MKKILAMVISIALVATMAITGSIAYLQDTDDAVNVMTLGNVDIELVELQRKDQSAANETDNLEAFNDEEPLYLYPAVYGEMDWDDDWQDWTTGGSNALFSKDMKNVVDKFVFVENTGKSDAYVRTWFAFEQGDLSEEEFEDLVGQNINGTHWKWETVASNVVIDNSKYIIKCATYLGNAGANADEHKDGVLPANETTRPSLLQVMLYKHAENDDVIALDYNADGEYNILVFSQAVQSMGFEDATTALNEAFGEVKVENHPWLGRTDINAPTEIPVDTLDELKAVFAEGGYAKLEDDIEFEKLTSIEPGAEVVLDLNGKTITVDENTTSNTLIWVKDGAKLTVTGNGTFDLGDVSTMAIFAPYGELVIENGTFIRNEITPEEVTDDTTGLFMGCKVTSSNVTINGGYFDPGYYDENAKDIEGILAGTAEFTETADDIAKRGNSKDKNLVRVAVKDNVSVLLNHSGYGVFKVYGGTFVGANPAWGDEGCMLPTTPNYLRPWSYYQGALLDGQTFNENSLDVPAGYTITKTLHEDGIRPVYTVSYSE